MFTSSLMRQSKCPAHLFYLIHNVQDDLSLPAFAPAGPDLLCPVSPCFIHNANQSFEGCIGHVFAATRTWHTLTFAHPYKQNVSASQTAYHGELIQYPFACFKCHSLSSSGVTCFSWWK